jgi:serine/threonine protein kinase
MSYCLNLNCSKPQNPPGSKFCITCGTKLLLGDRYRAIRPIGQGGFSKTFLGVDEYKPSQPRCVIKKFDYQGAGSQKAAELFEKEAVRLDELGKHPQIPELLAHFEQEQSNYLVQEFIDGQNLAEELETTGTFDEDKVCKLLNELLPVLEFIHSRQVIHRDIKPENIIRPSSGGKVVLVDFGAAKFVTGVTQMSKGTVIGTPEYVAPEQANGKAQFSSDLYSLATTCLHLLTQMNPLDLRNGSDWVWRDYLLNPVSDSLGYILDKMLEQEAHQRYQSAKDILKDLNQAKAKHFYDRGRQKAERGKYREAIDDFNHAIQINPSYAEAYYFRGIAYSRLREDQKAIADFQKAAELYQQQGKKADSQNAQDKISELNSLKHTLKSLDIDSQRIVAKQIFSSGADSLPDHLLVGKIYGFWETITCSERKYSSVTHWNIIDLWKESLLEIIQKLNVSQHYQKEKDLVISNLKSLRNDCQLKENIQTLTKEFFGLLYDSFNEKEKDDFLEKIVEDLQNNKVKVNKEELKKAGLKGILFGAAGLPALLIPVVSKIMLQKMTQGLLAWIMINILGKEAVKRAALGFLGGPIGLVLSIALTAGTGLAAFSQYKKEEQKAKFIQSILAVYLLSI